MSRWLRAVAQRNLINHLFNETMLQNHCSTILSLLPLHYLSVSLLLTRGNQLIELPDPEHYKPSSPCFSYEMVAQNALRKCGD